MMSILLSGSKLLRMAARRTLESSSNEPPRNTRSLSSSYQSSTHSHTLPAMSATPSGVAPAGYNPTGVGFPNFIPKFARFSSGSAFPHGYSRPSSPLAAHSHSASPGNRTPAQAQYAAASYQLTPVTGRFGCCTWSSQFLGSAFFPNPPACRQRSFWYPSSSTNRRYSSTVTG